MQCISATTACRRPGSRHARSSGCHCCAHDQIHAGVHWRCWLPGCGSHHHRQQCDLIGHLPMFGTRPWSNVQAPCLFSGRPSHSSASTAAGHERDIYADRCNLVVVAFKLFQSLTLAARQAHGSTQGAAARISCYLPNVHNMREYPSAVLKQMK